MGCDACQQKVMSHVGLVENSVKQTNGFSGTALLIGAAIGVGLLLAITKK